LDHGTLPDFVWISPNLCSSMHDCSIAAGDAWLRQFVPPILGTADFATSALFIVWDEGTSNVGGGGQVPLLLVSPMIPPRFRFSAPANHFNLLRTVEDAWGLGALGASSLAAPITSMFAATAAAPASFTASAAGTLITLTWQPPPGPAPTNYVLEFGSHAGLSDLVRVSTGSTATTVSGRGVPSGTYFVRVRAQTIAGLSVPSNEGTLVVGSAPGAPANLRLSIAGGLITLSWTPPATGAPPATYIIDVGSSPGRTDLASVATNSVATMVSGSGVVSGGPYYVRVRAQNGAGTSFPSNEVVLAGN
jgi:hypothetical protein